MNLSAAIRVSPAASVLKPALPTLVFERHLGRGVSQNRRQRPRPPGLKRPEGQFVRQGEMILKQFSLGFHPGLNVSIDRENTLFAMREGQVMMTVEKLNPKKDEWHVEKYYGKLSAPVVYKRFFHVIPFPQGKKFKLVDLI